MTALKTASVRAELRFPDDAGALLLSYNDVHGWTRKRQQNTLQGGLTIDIKGLIIWTLLPQ
jgi:hypothetical protein